MPADAIIREFRFFKADDTFDPMWKDWSRCYEYSHAIDVLSHLKPRTVHNSGCGYDPMQRDFAAAVDAIVPGTVHSDLMPNPVFRDHAHFRVHDMRQPFDGAFRCVLAISYIEEIPPSWHPTVLKNLWDQVIPGGRLIMTCDVERERGPSVSVPLLESWVDLPCERKEPLLTGLTSKLGARTDRNLKVVLVDIEKHEQLKAYQL
jgi:hypothetical protein